MDGVQVATVYYWGYNLTDPYPIGINSAGDALFADGVQNPDSSITLDGGFFHAGKMVDLNQQVGVSVFPLAINAHTIQVNNKTVYSPQILACLDDLSLPAILEQSQQTGTWEAGPAIGDQFPDRSGFLGPWIAESINDAGLVACSVAVADANGNVTYDANHNPILHAALLVPYDIDVDADNTTPATDYPDPTLGDLGPAEKAAEYSPDATNFPGVGVYENLFDACNNGVVGYADGIDKFGNGRANACWAFTPMLIDCGSLQAFPNAQFIFKYSASDPNQLTTSGSGDATQYILPDSGVLRIWKKDGTQIREPQTVDSSGDFIQTNEPYTSQQLGWQSGDKTIRLYIEAVQFKQDQSFNVEVDFYPLGTTHPESMAARTFRVCPRYVSFENPGAD